MEKTYRKCAPSFVPYPFFYFGKQPPDSYCVQEILFKIRYFERGLSKTFKKVNFIFSFKPSPF